MMVGTTCICNNGFFKVINADGRATCEPCDSTCSRCTNTADNCLECMPFRTLNSDNECPCSAGYIELDGFCVDTLCSAIPFCQSCYILLSNGESICQTCTNNRVPTVDGDKCVCSANFYETPEG